MSLALRGRRRRYADWRPAATACTRTDAATIRDVWALALDFREKVGAAAGGAGGFAPLSGVLEKRRTRQREASTWDLARRDVLKALEGDAAALAAFAAAAPDLAAARATPRETARALVDAFLRRS